MIVVQSTPLFLFLYPQAPVVEDAISISITPDRLELSLDLGSFTVDAQTFVTATVATLSLELTTHIPSVVITYSREMTAIRRNNRSAWQSRLGARMDPIRRKFLDNNILLTANATDMLRVRSIRDSRTQDILSRTITASEILPIVLPIMQDVPMRRLIKDDSSGSIVVTFSALEDQKPFEAYCPLSGQLQRDDLLFRFIKDPYADLPYIMVMQVKDELATLSYSSLLYVKYLLTFYDEPLPAAVVSEILAAVTKRERLKW